MEIRPRGPSHERRSRNMIAEGELRLRLDRIQSRALVVGGLGLVVCAGRLAALARARSCPPTWWLMCSGSGSPWAAWA